MFKVINLVILSISIVDSSLLPEDCGHSLNETLVNWRIAGGKDAVRGEFPWFSLLAIDYKPPFNMTDVCGGSIINHRWILTAAHCLPTISYNTFEVRLGVHNMSIHEKSEVDILIEKSVPHPDWDPTNIMNDIALLKLNESLDFKGKHKELRPICLTKTDTKLTNKCVTYGFGMTSQSQPNPKDGILQKLETSVADPADCRKRAGKIFHESTEICIIDGPKGGKAVCDGDSGGPIHCQGVDGRSYQVGIVSYGPSGCGSPYEADVYTKVSAYVNWIEKTIAKN